MSTISRRTLLKLGGSTLIGAPLVFVSTPAHLAQAMRTPIETTPTKHAFGRAIQGNLAVREQPSTKAAVVRKLARNEVTGILGQTTSDESPSTYNKIWYQTKDGWVHSAFVQLCDNTLNKPLTSIDPQMTLWGEITVPLSAARVQPDPAARAPWTHYFGTAFQILDVVPGADGKPWYRISDGILRNLHVEAEHMHVITPEELAPLSPNVADEDKHIEVDLKKQMLHAYEGDKEVFTARCATGSSFRQSDGSIKSYGTPTGPHHIYLKTPSQRMIGGAAGDASFYDLPGISWVSYFTTSGCAVHGTYWHNDYGKPRSHGCVNVLAEDAKWVYRWSLPLANYDARSTHAARGGGTIVKVF